MQRLCQREYKTNDMDLKKFLRLALIVEWASIVIGLVVYELSADSFPAKLQEYLKWEAQQESLLDNSFFILVILVWLLVSLLSAIGLFFFK
jgi:hypothetical protein